MATNTSATHNLISFLKEQQLDGIIVSHDDPHATEYPHPTFGALEFISGFTGSWGHALVTQQKAYLWTDGRYWVQAEQQLKEPWELVRHGMKEAPTLEEVIKRDNMKRVAIDLYTTSYMYLKRKRENLKDVEFVELFENPIYALWKDRPEFPLHPAFIHPEVYTGMSADKKLSLVREKMAAVDADALVVSLLDEVAYLLNLRGRDNPISPLIYAYVVVEKDTATIFIDPRKLTDDVSTYLESLGVKVDDYYGLPKYLETITERDTKKPAGEPFRLWVTPSESVAVCSSFLSKNCDDSPRELYQKGTPVYLMKGVKNHVELEGMKEAHILDGIALSRFFAHVENMRRDGTLFEHTEYSLGELSTHYRAQMEGNRGISFFPISSIGPNGAIIHYKPTEDECSRIDKQLYLLDSGGQYPGGTTDTTRCVHFGVPTAEEMEAYTLVLKGHLTLRHSVFPEGAVDISLDVLARQFLWKTGREYYHGTGHGVGAFLNVHEGPHRISNPAKPLIGELEVTGLLPGMVVSNEPGYYKQGHFGVRIENVVYVREMEEGFSKVHTKFYTFEDLTLVPYCKELVDVTLLTDEEIEWVNEYHKLVADTLIPRMEAISATEYADAISYLREAAMPIRK